MSDEPKKKEGEKSEEEKKGFVFATKGDWNAFTMGRKNELTLGESTEGVIGLETKVKLGAKMEICGGLALEARVGGALSFSKGPEFNVGEKEETTIKKEIQKVGCESLQLSAGASADMDGAYYGLKDAMKVGVAGTVASIIGLSTSIEGWDSKTGSLYIDHNSAAHAIAKAGTALSSAVGISTIAGVGMSTFNLQKKIASVIKGGNAAASNIKMNKDGILATVSSISQKPFDFKDIDTKNNIFLATGSSLKSMTSINLAEKGISIEDANENGISYKYENEEDGLIKIVHKRCTITVGKKNIEINNNDKTITISNEDIEINNNNKTIKILKDDIELKNGKSIVTLKGNKTIIEQGNASINITAHCIETMIGEAGIRINGGEINLIGTVKHNYVVVDS